MTESIESNKILEGTDYEGEIHLLINIKYTVIVVDTVSPIINNPHYMILVLGETNVRYCQQNIEATKYHYI